MARNKLSDLNDHLFAQLERLNDESISPEDMAREIEKAKAMEGIAKYIIDTNKVQLDRDSMIINAMDKGIIPVQNITVKQNTIDFQ